MNRHDPLNPPRDRRLSRAGRVGRLGGVATAATAGSLGFERSAGPKTGLGTNPWVGSVPCCVPCSVSPC